MHLHGGMGTPAHGLSTPIAHWLNFQVLVFPSLKHQQIESLRIDLQVRRMHWNAQSLLLICFFTFCCRVIPQILKARDEGDVCVSWSPESIFNQSVSKLFKTLVNRVPFEISKEQSGCLLDSRETAVSTQPKCHKVFWFTAEHALWAQVSSCSLSCADFLSLSPFCDSGSCNPVLQVVQADVDPPRM